MTKHIRVSWSILEAWARGDTDVALSMMNGNGLQPNQAMEIGRLAHERVSQSGILHKEIPKDAIYETINAEGVNRNKFVLSVYDWLTLSGIPDIKVPSTQTIIDLKTGVRKSYRYKPMQLYLYSYALSKQGEEYNRGIIFKLDSAGVNLLDYTVFKITEDKRRLAEDFIITYASEIFNFLNK